MRYDVRHRTTLSYDQLVSISQHVLHLEPRDAPRQTMLAFDLDVDPTPSQQTMRTDFFGNHVHHLTIQTPHDTLTVESKSKVEVVPLTGQVDLGSSSSWEQVPEMFVAREPSLLEPSYFAFPSPFIAWDNMVRDYALPSFPSRRPILEAIMDLTSRIYSDFEYQGGVSDVSTPVGEVLEMRRGVCQDFAHLEIACLRSIGVPARYVSGYLLTHPPPGEQKLIGSDASHAWLSAWAGTLGWVDYDPTNNLMPDFEHITVGWGRDYGDVSPVNGFITGGGTHSVHVGVDVAPAT
jgi:transglutaminase-like putative cysteine protease